MNLQELREKRANLYQEARSVVDAAQEEGRDLTEDEQKQVDEKLDSVESLKGDIQRMERMEDTGEELEASTRKTGGIAPRVTAHERLEDDPKMGFNHFGDFAHAVRNAGIPGGQRDERLNIVAGSASTSANEGSGADGGFLVPPEFRSEIRRLALEEESLYSLTDQNQIQGNSMRFPADETTPWGSNGVRARWEAEGTAATQDKPVLKTKELRLHKLISLVPATDELLEDTAALERYIRNQMGRSIRWKLNDALVNGTGSGQPMGVANANAKVTVSRNTASEVNAVDVATMYGRLLPSSQRNAVWLMHNEVFEQLITMSVSNQPVFTAPNQGIQESPGGMLMGRPVVLTQTAETLGTQGDVRLVDWNQYVTAEKAGGIQNEMSIHLFFDADQVAFRATFRADGQPWLDSSVSQNKGSNNLSTIVELK